MDADLDTFVTALYVTIDDTLRTRPELRQWRPEAGARTQALRCRAADAGRAPGALGLHL